MTRARGTAGPRGARRAVVYQLLPRLFANTNTRNERGAGCEVNGTGKLAGIDDVALEALRGLGATHLWLTGVLEHATRTAYAGLPADDPDIVKGTAGSPFAVRDCFDVCPDLAVDPARRLDEFRDFVARAHGHGLAVLLDFVPNHVARSHASDVRPDVPFGADDDRSVFFARDNHFFYLQRGHAGGGPPLRLPRSSAPGSDGLFEPESTFGRVSGNNVLSWAPSPGDWYETVKLNYGHDFTRGRDTSHLPGPTAAMREVPATWRTMDAVLAHWQALGVDGFRADMAHMVPLEFWRWALRRARERDPRAFFCAEAYDNDPAKLCDGDVRAALVEAGFDAVYDDALYDLLEGLYEGGKWCNDLDAHAANALLHARSLRYVENHDEVRIANPRAWGGVGMRVGKPAAAVAFGLGTGPLLVHHGQEVGEPAEDAPNARTSIFEYGACPELARWVNGGRFDGGGLAPERRALREWYRRLLAIVSEPPFTRGELIALNRDNVENQSFGRLAGDSASGHWLYAFLRRDEREDRTFLVAANFHPSEVLAGARARLAPATLARLGGRGETRSLREVLAGEWTATASGDELAAAGLPIPPLAPCSAAFVEIAPAAP